MEKIAFIGIKSAPINGTNKRIVLEDYFFKVNGKLFYIPEGFFYDGASVPRFVWWICPPYACADTGAATHDFFCKTGIFSKKMSDLIFLLVMRHRDVFFLIRGVLYYGVRMFGILYWKKDRRKDSLEENVKFLDKYKTRLKKLRKSYKNNATIIDFV